MTAQPGVGFEAGPATRVGPLPVLAEVVRSGLVESRHVGSVAVCDAGGRLLASLGDPQGAVFPRSASKPLQALAVFRLGVDERLGLGAPALAGACGSHAGAPVHVDNARAVLAAAGLEESDLCCPPALPADETARASAPAPARIYHNCSAKHAYMLAGCVASGWPTGDYTAPTHPLQQAVRRTIEELCGAPVEHLGVDGCGVPVHALPLAAVAAGYARLGALAADGRPGPADLLAAVRTFPVLISGAGRFDTRVLELTAGAVLTKAGAEAVYAAAYPERGLGVALKVLDGSGRAGAPAVFGVLAALGWLDGQAQGELAPVVAAPVLGGGAPVGAVRPVAVPLAPR